MQTNAQTHHCDDLGAPGSPEPAVQRFTEQYSAGMPRTTQPHVEIPDRQLPAIRPNALLTLVLSLLMLTSLQGCVLGTRTMLDLGDVAVPRATTADAVRSAFVTAGFSRGRIFNDAGAGKLRGVLKDPQLFTATMEVAYGATSYRISHVDSTDLAYTPASPERIHSRYNRWLRDLNKDVQELLNKGS